MIRSSLAALGLAALAASPALGDCPNTPPVHTRNAVLVNAAGAVQMVVLPTDDCELDEPTFNPPGLSQVRVPTTGAPIALAVQASPVLSASLSVLSSLSPSSALSSAVSASTAISSSLVR